MDADRRAVLKTLLGGAAVTTLAVSTAHSAKTDSESVAPLDHRGPRTFLNSSCNLGRERAAQTDCRGRLSYNPQECSAIYATAKYSWNGKNRVVAHFTCLPLKRSHNNGLGEWKLKSGARLIEQTRPKMRLGPPQTPGKLRYRVWAEEKALGVPI